MPKGNDWNWGSALVGVLGGAALYEPALARLQQNLATQQQAYDSLRRQLAVQQKAYQSLQEALRLPAASEALRALSEPVSLSHPVVPAPSAPDHEKMQALEKKLARVEAENRTLKETLHATQQEVERLDGDIAPTDRPLFEWPNDSLPWSTSPD